MMLYTSSSVVYKSGDRRSVTFDGPLHNASPKEASVMLSDSTNPPALPPGLIDVRGVIGFPGYAVGHDGIEASVWTCRKIISNKPSIIGRNWKRMKPWKGKTATYLTVGLRKNNQHHRLMIHRIVAESFLGPVPVGQEVRHGPNGKYCNLPSNLSYGTRSQNHADKRRDGTHIQGEASTAAKLTEADIIQIIRLRRMGKMHKEIAVLFGVSVSNIGMIINRKTWKHLRVLA